MAFYFIKSFCLGTCLLILSYPFMPVLYSLSKKTVCQASPLQPLLIMSFCFQFKKCFLQLCFDADTSCNKIFYFVFSI